MLHIQSQRVPTHAIVEPRIGPQRLELATKYQGAIRSAAYPAMVERLFAETIPHQCQTTLASIPKSDCEHAHGATDRGLHPPMLERGEQSLGVRVTPPNRSGAGCCQLVSNVEMIINFTIEDEHETTADRTHRLMTSRRPVDDGQTPMRQTNARHGVAPHARIIWPAMSNRIRHSHAVGF